VALKIPHGRKRPVNPSGQAFRTAGQWDHERDRYLKKSGSRSEYWRDLIKSQTGRPPGLVWRAVWLEEILSRDPVKRWRGQIQLRQPLPQRLQQILPKQIGAAR